MADRSYLFMPTKEEYMSLPVDIGNAIDYLALVQKSAVKEHNRIFILADELTKLHQKYRLAKRFDLSDEIRDILKKANIKIIQGTAGYKYEDIPKAMINHTIDDTWEKCELA